MIQLPNDIEFVERPMAGPAAIIDWHLQEQNGDDDYFRHNMSSVVQGRPWENPANDIDTLDPSFSYDTPSGVAMNESIALTYAPVWQAVSLISGDIAKLQLALCRKIKDKTKEWLWDHELTDLVCKRPNAELGAVRFWRRSILHYLLYGNCYIYVRRDPFTYKPLELIHLLPDRTYPLRHPEDNFRIWYWAGITTPPWHWPLPAEDVIHVEWNQDVPYELMGVNTTRAAKNSWALGLAQEIFAGNFFRHGGRIGGILELPAAMHRDAKENLSRDFRQVYEGASNAFKTVVLRDNAKFHQGQFNFRETQLVEGQEENARQVARWFNLPPDKLGVSGAASYNSKQEDNRNYLEQTLGIILKSFCDGLNQRLLMPNQRRRHFFEHDTREMVAPDPPARADMAVKLFASNLTTQDESRAILALPPRPDGDQLAYELIPEPIDNQTGEGDAQGGKSAARPVGDQAKVKKSSSSSSSSSGSRFEQMKLVLPMVHQTRRNNRKSVGAVTNQMAHGMKEYRDMPGGQIVDSFVAEVMKAAQSGGDVKGRIEIVLDEWENRYADS